MRIKPIEYDNASKEAKKEFDDQIASHGRITNMKRTLLHSVPAFKTLMEWYTLRDKVAEFIGDNGVNIFCYAISHTNDCLICSTFFRKIIKDNGGDPDNLSLSKEEKVLIDFGQKCVKDQHNMDDELFNRLKELYSDEQIILLTAFAGMMIATNLINNILDVELDEYLISYTKR